MHRPTALALLTLTASLASINLAATSFAQTQATRTPVSSTRIKDTKTTNTTICTRYAVSGKTTLEVYCGTPIPIVKR